MCGEPVISPLLLETIQSVPVEHPAVFDLLRQAPVVKISPVETVFVAAAVAVEVPVLEAGAMVHYLALSRTEEWPLAKSRPDCISKLLSKP